MDFFSLIVILVYSRLTRSCLLVRINARNQESTAVTYCLHLLIMSSITY